MNPDENPVGWYPSDTRGMDAGWMAHSASQQKLEHTMQGQNRLWKANKVKIQVFRSFSSLVCGCSLPQHREIEVQSMVTWRATIPSHASQRQIVPLRMQNRDWGTVTWYLANLLHNVYVTPDETASFCKISVMEPYLSMPLPKKCWILALFKNSSPHATATAVSSTPKKAYMTLEHSSEHATLILSQYLQRISSGRDRYKSDTALKWG